VNLIPSELRLRALAGNHDGPARGVDLPRMLKSDLLREKEELLKHFDHIVVRMLVIVQQNDMKKMSALCTFVFLDGRCDRGSNGALHGQGDVSIGTFGREDLQALCLSRVSAHPRTVRIKLLRKRGRNGFDGIESLCEGVSGSELP